MKNVLKRKLYQVFAKRIVKKHTTNINRHALNDREVLEKKIIPNILAEINPKKIMDIGREEYQGFYNHFFRGRELWTIDKDPDSRGHGSENHITDDVANLGSYFKKNYFDLIIMNGVFGWGLNEKEKIEKAFNAIYKNLNKGGIFILGYNNIKDLIPLPLNKIKALNKLKPYYFKSLKTDSFKCHNGEHTYNFYTK